MMVSNPTVEVTTYVSTSRSSSYLVVSLVDDESFSKEEENEKHPLQNSSRLSMITRRHEEEKPI